MSIFQEFKWRGVLNDYTNETEEYLAVNKVTAYIGFDPTASSLHVGSLLPIMCLARLQKYGHKPLAIVGGGTGMIGDPSGKIQERRLLSREKIEENLLGIKSQLALFLDFSAGINSANIINNAEWLLSLSMMDFLRDVGKYFTINYMRSKDSVKKREEEGISFTEFSYMLLQAYDFYILCEKYNCTLQMGGSDQWGNIIAGIDLIGKKTGKQAYGLTFPLVTSSTGIKFGKTESGTIWLDPNLTSPYRFYQFWLNTSDDDVIRYLKYFSWLTENEIKKLEDGTIQNPEKRVAQHVLAEEMTKMVHGVELLNRAKIASDILFGGDVYALSSNEIKDIFSDVPSSNFLFTEISRNTISIIDLLFAADIVASKGEGRRVIENGGIYVNNIKITHAELIISPNHAIEDKYIVIRKGKKNFHLINLI